MSLDPAIGRLWLFRFFMNCMVLIACASCGPRDPRVTIHGTVSLDGQPLSEGEIVFTPDDPALRAEGATINHGSFTIRVLKRPHRIGIRAYLAEKREVDPNAPPGASSEFTTRSIIPTRYNDKSTLSFTVESSKDRPRFDLTSDTLR